MKKQKPRGFWKKKENQKEFLDSLLRKYRIEPEEIGGMMIRENGGRTLEIYYKDRLEMLETHYGELNLLDVPFVPDGTWDKPEYRKRAVRQAIQRLGKRPGRVTCDDFERIGLKGLLNHSGLGFRSLLREAGYDVPDPVSWQSGKVRVRKIRELVEKAGGTDRITLLYIKERARGLIEYYEPSNESVTGHWASLISELPEGLPIQKGLPGAYIPTLYWILKDAGFDVSPDDCMRGLNALEDVMSLHGHRNHSLAEALMDDWMYDIVGMDHMHDVIYPGQKNVKKYTEKDCDFILLSPQARKNPHSELCTPHSELCTPHFSSLWLEYAGLWSKRKNWLVRKYKRGITTKKALAKKANIPLVVITPADMKKPKNVWDEMVSKAPWLKKRSKAALQSRFLSRFCEDSDV